MSSDELEPVYSPCCKQQVPRSATFCTRCGKSLQPNPAADAAAAAVKSRAERRLAAALIGIALAGVVSGFAGYLYGYLNPPKPVPLFTLGRDDWYGPHHDITVSLPVPDRDMNGMILAVAWGLVGALVAAIIFMLVAGRRRHMNVP